MIKELLSKVEDQMKKTVEKFKSELAAIRSSRASISLVENIDIDCYNSKMKLNQVASLNIIEGKTIEIRPWDTTILSNIEKSIQLSSIGLKPINDGKMIKLNVPPLTDERRNELSKQINKLAESFRVSIRNERRLLLDDIKNLKKDKKITEDDEKKAEAQLQKLTENYIKKIDELLQQKIKEINE